MCLLIDQDSEKIFRSENFSDFRRKEDFEADEFSEHESFSSLLDRTVGRERMRGDGLRKTQNQSLQRGLQPSVHV